jgi:hypothetical protein
VDPVVGTDVGSLLVLQAGNDLVGGQAKVVVHHRLHGADPSMSSGFALRSGVAAFAVQRDLLTR